ncbi:hypothetical protein [Tsuneonella suprasediminis]|uniref:hypothetical protein n=1 Tax=Tsuneonella suprasediminis TaxID=2306996 RepID=UPI002F9406AE
MTGIPSGVVMICVDDTGREIATVHDFDRSGYGGFTLQRSQEIRCKNRLARAVIDRYSNPIISATMSEWHRDELLKNLISKHGYKVHTVFLPEELQDNGGDA